MTIKDSVIATTTVWGVQARIVEQVDGPLAGKAWVAVSNKRQLTERQLKILEGADTALERGGVEGALAFLDEIQKWQAPKE
jgi:hypothetical protein